jgi:transcriptional regulator with XRE-family HTH domain
MKKRIHPTDKHVGARMRMRRIMLHKSQSEVAEALGLFGRIREPKVRRAVVALVEQIVVEPAERVSGTGASAVVADE